ncbi:response regulator [Thalassoglobus polymorphus]|uniref:Alkaline phosphatase synthesis transcriptional regulatory protein PhoP n=1 Tax=Thalassoglobus polymorphus TaxID=2527994 RepID=A0A517QMP3_9PLAN|nr:response regulator transcription factor [Thalassoglobus polymorphus]QDT32909.1 Alkaline phosphatase synthesis transcriptional regulatory protein PhoP [Thalassoglobus polymorphus]
MPKQTILIIEDEQAIIDVLSYNLTKEGFEVITANDGQKGVQLAESVLPDLVILDLMLPVIDGLQVCRTLRGRAKTQDLRILMLTARSEEVDEIVGFNMGADDYVSKPFKIKPLVHRIKALLRRSPSNRQSKETISIEGIEVDRLHHVAKLNEKELQLTPTEFDILWTLARQPGRPFSRLELMDRCRGEDANSLERTIDVHIRSLRIKLGDHSTFIDTVRGIGYRFQLK